MYTRYANEELIGDATCRQLPANADGEVDATYRHLYGKATVVAPLIATKVGLSWRLFDTMEESDCQVSCLGRGRGGGV